MKNGYAKVENGKLILTFDLDGTIVDPATGAQKLSSTGKSAPIAGSDGMERVPGNSGFMFQATVYRRVNGN